MYNIPDICWMELNAEQIAEIILRGAEELSTDDLREIVTQLEDKI